MLGDSTTSMVTIWSTGMGMVTIRSTGMVTMRSTSLEGIAMPTDREPNTSPNNGR